MFRIAIAEDDQACARQLQEYLERYGRENGEELEVHWFPDGMELAEEYRPVYDLLLLDIEMPHLDGMTAARKIRRADSEVLILFITNLARYAISGYEVEALGFMLKPVNYFSLSVKLKKAFSYLHSRAQKSLMIHTRDGIQKISASDIRFFFGRNLAGGGRYDVDVHQTLFSSIGTLAVVWLLSTAAQTLAADNPGISIVCHLYGIFCCVSMFWGQVNQRNRSRLERELVLQQQLARQQREQYELTRETIDIINRKCHDLKHQVAALRNISSEEQREAHLSEIERSIQIYDSTLETGSRVLDTVLTEKSLYCGAHQITMTCMADGRRLSFLDDVDVYTIFGNAIDNAIESVSGLTDPEKRAIAVSVWSKSGLLLIQFENYFEGTLRFENGLPLTTKADKSSHGFGIRSIGYTVKKYGGHMAVSAEDHLFLLSISIPLPQ